MTDKTLWLKLARLTLRP